METSTRIRRTAIQTKLEDPPATPARVGAKFLLRVGLTPFHDRSAVRIDDNDRPHASNECGDQVAAYKAIIAVDLVIDAAMLLLPVPVILTMLLKKLLRVKKPYKAALFAMPMVGAV